MRIFHEFSGFIVRILIAGLSWFPAGILALFVWAFLMWTSAVFSTNTGIELSFPLQITNSFDEFISIVRYAFLILLTIVIFFLFPSRPGTWGMQGWKRVFPALIAVALIISVHEWYLAVN
jgi:hypothetical protein